MKTNTLQSIKTRFGIIGNSFNLNHSLEVACQIAPTDLSIYIIGESGVGKEVFSQVIHKLSLRKHEPFIAINCGAIPEGTIDSELFGHEKGSFTGAEREREGYFEKVNGGTIFLDEIGEMPLSTQSRLLRVLETGEYIRVGASTIRKTDVRVIVATNRDLYQEIQQGKFRQDLFYRLNTIPIYVPSLRERKEDIPLLFRKFCVDYSIKYHSNPKELSDEAVELLKQYKWEGNVRQLKNVAEQLSVLEKNYIIDDKILKTYLPTNHYQLAVVNQNQQTVGNELEAMYKLFLELKSEVDKLKKIIVENNIVDSSKLAEDRNQILSSNNVGLDYNSNIDQQQLKLPSLPTHSSPTQVVDNYLDNLNIAEMEKDLVLKALEKHNGRKRNAAVDLGISERTLYRKIKDYGIEN